MAASAMHAVCYRLAVVVGGWPEDTRNWQRRRMIGTYSH